jgi:hypothetical protein
VLPRAPDARIICPDIGTKVLVRPLGWLEDGGGLLCPGSFTHSPKLLSCPWERDPWGTCQCFGSSPYSTRSNECLIGSPTVQGCSPVLRRDLFRIQRNLQDKLQENGVFDRELGNKHFQEKESLWSLFLRLSECNFFSSTRSSAKYAP